MDEAETSPSPPVLAKPVPGIAQSAALCALFFGIVIAVAIPLEVLKRFAGLPLDMFSLLLIQQVIAWPITIWVGLRWARVSFREVCPLTRFPVRIVPALLIATFGVTILVLAAAGLIPMPEALRAALIQQAAGSSKLTLFLPVVVVAPLAEEIFFRGFMLRGYLGRYSITKAVWASAAVFALFHLNPWQMVAAFPLGLGFAWLFLRTGSLIPGILSHAMANFSTNFLLTPLGLALGYDADAWEELRNFPPSVLAVGAVTAIIGGFILWRQVAGFPPRPNATPS